MSKPDIFVPNIFKYSALSWLESGAKSDSILAETGIAIAFSAFAISITCEKYLSSEGFW